MKKLIALVMLFVMMLPGVVLANDAPPTITVDGVEYGVAQVSGHVSHFFTPPPSNGAFTERNTWNGVNGAEHIEGCAVVHWVDNKNRLVISHCETEATTTTSSTSTTSTTSTTVPDTTTTTTIVEETTTTNVEESTTTTIVEEETSTTANDETTSTENRDTETPDKEEGEVLPFTGVNGYWFLGALALSLAGLAALGYASRFVKE